MSISVSGLSSGIDYESMITKLMAVESQPLTVLQTKEANYQSKLTAFGSIKSAVSNFQTAIKALASASTFQGTSANVVDSTVATVTATSAAKTGTHSLEVSKLAQAQKLAAAGQASTTTAIGSGTLTFDFGTISGGTLTDGIYTGASFTSSGAGAKTVTIDSSNNSLAGIRDAINNANIGVTATIVNDGGTSPYRLALTSQNTGAANSMKISVAGDAALSTLLSQDPAGSQALTETATAQDAALKIDGISITKSSNTITDAIDGLTLNLTKTNSGSPTNITVARDTASVTNAVNSLVTAYNTLANTLKNASAYDATTKTAAVLNGESSIRTIQTQIRNVLNTPVSGGASAFTMLSQVGVSIQKDGTMAVDSVKLSSALASNFDDFAGLFAAAGKTSDSLVTYSTASSKAQPGEYDVNITQLATQGSITGTGITVPLTIDSTNQTLTVQLDGNSATISLATGTYATAAALASEIQSKINGVSTFSNASSAVKVSESGGALTITSNRYGSASNINITGGTSLGLTDSTIGTGVDVAGTINGVAASGSGQKLTGATGDASEGISLIIAGGSTGSRGTVNYSQGFAYQLNALSDSLLSSNGPITSRTDGLSATIKQVQSDEEALSTRLTSIEANYRSRFTALETLLSSMNSTSSYLTQQITAMQNLNSQTSK